MKACAPVVAAVAATATLVVTPLVAATAAVSASTSRSTGSAVVFKAPLSGAAEVPPVPSAATGVALALLSDAIHLSVTWSFSGLPTPVDLGVGIHLHEAPAGANGPVLIPLTPDVALKAGGTGGCGWSKVALNSSQADALVAGNLYLNVHTKGNPAGALRGQLRPAISGGSPADGEVVASPTKDPDDGFFGEDNDTVGFPAADVPEVTASAADGDDVDGGFVGPSDGPVVEGGGAVGFPAVDEPEASAPSNFPAVDVPEVTAPAADFDDDEGALLNPSAGPWVGGDEAVGFPVVDEPDASAPAAGSDDVEDAFVGPSDGPVGEDDEAVGFPADGVPEASAPVDGEDAIATDGDDDGFFGDSTDGFESNDVGFESDSDGFESDSDGFESDDSDGDDGADDAVGGNVVAGQTTPPVPKGGDDNTTGPAAAPTVAADANATPTPYVVRVERV